LRRESNQVDSVVASKAEPAEAGQSVRQSDLRLPVGVLRPQAPGRPRSVQESIDDRAGRCHWPPRDRTQSQSESDRHHLRKAGGMPAAEDATVGGKLSTAELGAPQDSQGFQNISIGTRGKSL